MVEFTENHVDTADPVVIEGDAILPSLLSRPTVQTRTSHGQIQAVFLVEPEEDALLAHMDVRDTNLENQLTSVTDQRNTLANQMVTILEQAEFNNQPINEQQAQQLIDQGNALLQQVNGM